MIGGGLAGLVTAIRLARKNIACTLIEKKQYPFHRVCGEYISNETKDFLTREGLFPETHQPPHITHLHLSAVNGNDIVLPLDLGGFGISRFTFDHFLYEKAYDAGVQFYLNSTVHDIVFNENSFEVRFNQETLSADFVIGAFGKRSRLDVALSRRFIKKRSPYVAVKYHAITQHPQYIIALHNFKGGYCGASNVENNRTNICYLTLRDNVKQFGSIATMEENVLFKNPHIKSLFTNSEFLFDRPEVINEISFEQKSPVENHVLMTGDAAGMIAPLCGNGMAMAIHSAKIVSDLIIEQSQTTFNRSLLEREYTKRWNLTFANRLWRGRFIQNKLFGSAFGSAVAVNLVLHSRFLANTIMRNTHGSPF